MTTEIIRYEQDEVMTPQAVTDSQLIALWLHGKSVGTQRQYEIAMKKFFGFVAKPLGAVTLKDLQDFVDSLQGPANTRKRIVACIKSLFTFGQKVNYLRFNVAAAIKAPKAKDELAARILTEDEVLTMIYKTDKQRDNSRVGSGFGKNVSKWVGRDMAYPSNVLHMATETSNKNHSAVFPMELPLSLIHI